jgi:probable O-glycosylation ligase (exosortase A-associated)
MRDLAFFGLMLGLLPLAAARPFVGVLLWCWISFMNPHRQLYGFAADLPWAAVVFVVTAFGMLAGGDRWRPAVNGVTLLIVALMACFVVTTVEALGPAGAVWGKFAQTAKVLLGLLITACLVNDRWRLHALIWVMVLSLGYYGVRGGVFAIVSAGAHRVYGPMQTMIEDNNHLAAGLLVTLPLMNYLRMQSRHTWVRHALVAAMGLTLLAVLASYSRGALLGLAAATLVLWWRSRQKLLSAVLLAVVVGGAISFMPDRWTQRMDTINTYEEDASATDRLVMWQTAWKLALERPLLGAGFLGPYTRQVVDRVDPDSPARAVHSIWFEVIGEHGFPTFAVWLALTFSGLWYGARLMRLARDRPDLAWAGDLGRMAQVSVVAYVVAGTFLSLSYWDFYWTLLVGLAAAHSLALAASRPAGTASRQWAQAAASEPAPARRAWSGQSSVGREPSRRRKGRTA